VLCWLLHCADNSNDYEYKNAAQDILPKNEVQIYTWPDATLREITTLLKDVIPTARQRNASLNYCIVYPDKRGVHVIRQVGKISRLLV
jgi:histone deacetylase complex subunit SAP18